MSFSKLWTRLFTKNTMEDSIALHVSGATVRHRNSFEDLGVPRNEADLDGPFIEEWVQPFYLNWLSNVDEEAVFKFARGAGKINLKVVQTLLGDFNWRMRIVGAYFAAINNYDEVLEIIGKHLLKSEVCYAGKGYCYALAAFGGDRAKYYLTTYLDYYLGRTDLWFDQADAFCALHYLDKALADRRLPIWNSFIGAKPNWDLEGSRLHFNAVMATIGRIRAAKNRA